MSSILFSKRHNPKFGRNRKPRAKTFRTEAGAKAWADKKGMSGCTFVKAKKDRVAIKQ
jgi:hypothetical protein